MSRMNLDPSDLPRIAGAARLSKPGFDIILAVSSARQAMLPTVRQLRARAQRDRHAAKLNALRYILCGRRGSTEQKAPSRSEERRGGKECVSSCRSRWSQYH